MGLAFSITGAGKLINSSTETRRWIKTTTDEEGERISYRVVETVRSEEREWYALNKAGAIYEISHATHIANLAQYAISEGDVSGLYYFAKETGEGTELYLNYLVYWDDVNQWVTDVAGDFEIVGYVWEWADTFEDEVLVAIANLWHNVTLTDPVIGAYTLSRNIESKVLTYPDFI